MVVKVYITSVTGSREVKSQQSELTRILDSKGIKYETIDISVDNSVRDEMRNKCGNPKAIPPQIFNEDQYCGDFVQLTDAAENECLEQFLKL
ncbi:SH3 domain-binding glutamic acid-rich-like protein 3 [Discoglossus pictus]